jgi:transcriptional regulator with XRE-family HTH domain
MTYVIPVSSLKQPRAERFARELERAMSERKVGSRPLAESVGCGRSAVQQWRHGSVLPRITMAQRLAEALDWPRLESLAAEVRRKECVVCKAGFVDDSGSDNRVYCSMECRRVKASMDLGTDRRQRSSFAEHRLRSHMAAIAEMCRQCQPDGMCVDAECPLRAVSPLPLRAA